MLKLKSNAQNQNLSRPHELPSDLAIIPARDYSSRIHNPIQFQSVRWFPLARVRAQTAEGWLGHTRRTPISLINSRASVKSIV